MSRQFDVYSNPLKWGRGDRPFIIIVQHSFFDEYPTRIVAPLVIVAAIRPRPRLNPMVTVDGRDLHFSPTELATISLKHLRNPVTNLESDRDKLIAALDLVFTGI